MPQYGMKMMENSSRASQKLKLMPAMVDVLQGFAGLAFPVRRIYCVVCEVWAGLPCDSEPPKPTASHQARLLNICGIAGVFTPIMISYLRRSEGGGGNGLDI